MNGYIQGLAHDEYVSFYGIPFASPPVGPARWQPPIDPESWSPKVLDARYPNFGCPQNCELPPGCCPTNTSEDCLYLNVFTPLDAQPGDVRPVMAFLPGGRFEQGAANSVLYNAHTMVNSSGAIVVTINYRLGVLGFLVTDDFPGNFGFQDQRMALMWIQNNIASFGGDPNQVTLVGQSAGATSIAAHLTSPLSYGLFHRAISESNPFTLGLKSKFIAQQFSQSFADAVNCSISDPTCLLSLNPDQVIQGQIKAQAKIDPVIPLESFLPWTPTVDGADIIDQPLTLFSKGLFYDIPLMIGTVSEEALLFIYQAATKNVSELDYEVVLDLVFLKNAGQVNQKYPPNGPVDNRPILSTLGTDYIFVCPTRLITDYIFKYNVKQSPIYHYQFSHVLSFDAWGPLYPNCVGHVCHGSELVFIFNSATYGGYNFTSDEQQLAYSMNNYWMNFVVSGNPNQGLPVPVQWPTYNTASNQSLIFQAPTPYVTTNLLSSQCNFFDKVGYDGR
eukprot:gene2541-3144_t